jgi:hypothetical protein
MMEAWPTAPSLLRLRLTEAIYRVWYGMFDRVAATQLASVLIGVEAMVVGHPARPGALRPEPPAPDSA